MLYPIVTESRSIINLDGVWAFKADNGHGFEKQWYKRPLEDAILMPVPASYNDMTEDIALRDHYGWVFYERDFYFPRALRNERAVLRMDAVTHRAKVYLNGEFICEHKGGFLPFEAEVTDKIKEGKNLLCIAADNRIDYTTLPLGRKRERGISDGYSKSKITLKKKNIPGFDFFNYCGITRPVRLYTTPMAYIDDITLTSGYEGTKGFIDFKIDTVGRGKTAVKVYDSSGVLIDEKEGGSGRLEIDNVCLWQPLKPYLYEVKICFGDDSYTLPYGIRTVKIEGQKFLINGQPFYFKGYGKHEDTFPAGRGLNMPMNLKDLSLLKWQGANSFRTSHYPYSEEMMRLCDREGIVVIDETPAVGLNLKFGGGDNFTADGAAGTYDKKDGIQTAAHHRDVIREMIRRDKNHACVVMWSIANEPDSDSEGAYDYFKPLFDLAKETDPQKRPCTMVTNQVPDPTKDVSVRLSDVYCLNRYYGWYESGGDLETAKKLLEAELAYWISLGKPVMMTEYGADTVAGLHDTVPVMFTEEYQVAYYEMNHEVFDRFAGFIGEHAWNFADFMANQETGRVQGNKKGIFTRDRRPKMIAHILKKRWENIPDFNYKK